MYSVIDQTEKLVYLKGKINLLCKSEKEFIAFAINRFGDGQHPIADADNLRMFNTQYAYACVKEAMLTGDLTGEGARVAASVVKTIG